jgi:Fe-S oxidoreductase
MYKDPSQMNPPIITILLALGIGAFIFSIWRRIRLLASLKKAPEPRLNMLGQRLLGIIEFVFGQLRLLKRDTMVGLMHAFIFWGFIVVAIHSIELFGQGFSINFQLPLLDGSIRSIYQTVLTIFEILVLIAVVWLLMRRLVMRPERLTLSVEADLILVAIGLLMVTDLVMEFSDNRLAYRISYWSHTAGILAFLNWLPYSKHFHIITSIPNVFLQRTTSYGELSTLDLEDESAESFGTEKTKDLNWKQGLDLMTCTECGRCQDVCPAYAAEKPLSPKELSLNLRDQMYAKNSAPLVPDAVKAETLWSCTTCRACEEACPLFIEYVDRIVDMRRNLVLMKGDIPAEMATALKNIEAQGNPWGLGSHTRGDWAADLDVPLIKDNPNAEYLFFVGCAGSFDDRAKKISRALVKILKHAGISFAILGAEETCTGDSARRMGNEYLFQELARKNIETFNRYGIKKILTQCPHCYNTLKNEYPSFGGTYEVTHHTELIAEVSSKFKVQSSNTVAYHDSCYLGRYNNMYNQPRVILKAMGITVAEPSNTRDNGLCCGAGGGLMWMEDREGKRMNHIRAEELSKTGAKIIATSCPFCLTMLSDAYQDLGRKDITVKDLAEIVANP